jgi:hypothetical protein
VFEPILQSSRLPLTVPRALHGSGGNGAQVGSWRGCLVRSLLGDIIFPCGVMRWMGEPSPMCRRMVHIQLRGDRACLWGAIWSHHSEDGSWHAAGTLPTALDACGGIDCLRTCLETFTWGM